MEIKVGYLLVCVDKFPQVYLVLSKSHVRGCATYCAPVRSRPLRRITSAPAVEQYTQLQI